MEYKVQVGKAGALSTEFEGSEAGLEMEVGKWVRIFAFATHAILGGTRRKKRARAVREVGQKLEGLKLLLYVAERLKDNR